MYICPHCGHGFDEPARWEERHGLDTPPYEQFSGCPLCCSEDYEQSEDCVLCHTPTAPSQLERGLCPGCQRDTVKEFQRLLLDAFTVEQLEYLNDAYDGESF